MICTPCTSGCLAVFRYLNDDRVPTTVDGARYAITPVHVWDESLVGCVASNGDPARIQLSRVDVVTKLSDVSVMFCGYTTRDSMPGDHVKDWEWV